MNIRHHYSINCTGIRKSNKKRKEEKAVTTFNSLVEGTLAEGIFKPQIRDGYPCLKPMSSNVLFDSKNKVRPSDQFYNTITIVIRKVTYSDCVNKLWTS